MKLWWILVKVMCWYWGWTQLAGDSSPGALVTRSLCKLFTPTDALSPSCSLCRRHSRLVSDFFVLWLQLCPGSDWFTETQLALAWTKRTFVPLTASLGGTGSLRITLLVKDSEVLLQIRILFVLLIVWGDVVSQCYQKAELGVSPSWLLVLVSVPHSAHTAPSTAHGCVAFFPWCQRTLYL